MRQTVDLRRKFRDGSIIGGLAGGLSLLGALGTVFVWLLFGASGLAAEMVSFDIVIFLAVFGLQQQIDSLLMAMRGGFDTSDFSQMVRHRMDPSEELQQLRSLLVSLQDQLSTLSAQDGTKRA